MKLKLEHQVAAAVGAMLVGREEITLEDVSRELPQHILAAGPSLKAMTKALVSAGWIAERRDGGTVMYVPPRPEGEEPGRGHNRFTDTEAAAEVREIVEGVESLLDAKKELGEDIKDAWAAAKSRGHDPKALQTLIKMRAKKPEERHQQEAILEVYLRAMGMME